MHLGVNFIRSGHFQQIYSVSHYQQLYSVVHLQQLYSVVMRLYQFLTKCEGTTFYSNMIRGTTPPKKVYASCVELIKYTTR